MELIRGLHNLYPHHRGCVATMGGFDGVHLGHQAILERLSKHAQKLNLPSTVITFEPLPREFFAPEQAPPRLTRLVEKLSLFKAHHVDRVLCLYFNQTLYRQSAEEFAHAILIGSLGIQYLLVGEAFKFGFQRKGDIHLLRTMGQDHHFQVESLPSLTDSGLRISSTRIREALQSGNMQYAEQLLGRPYSITGRVANGNARGRNLGFPTANIDLKRRRPAIKGVYAVRVKLKNNQQTYVGVANIGTRPTFSGQRYVLEVHLFDFERNIYGQTMQVQFLHKIRAEQRFESVEQLTAQIAQDIQQAKTFFANQ